MDTIALLKTELSQLEAETFELEAVLAPDNSNMAAAVSHCTSTSSCSSSCCSCTSTSS